jgi:hypothetical protein
MISKPLGQFTGIPDASLNEKLVPTNDNHEPSALSRENFEAESILIAHDSIKPRKLPLLVIIVLCLLVGGFISWGMELLSSAQ